MKIRIRPLSRSSTKTVSLKPSSAATAWRRSSGICLAVEEDAERVAPLAVLVGEDAEDVELGHA